MKIIYLLIICLVSNLIEAQEIISNTPSEITIEFIKDFKKWNDYAYNLSLVKSDNDEQIEQNTRR